MNVYLPFSSQYKRFYQQSLLISVVGLGWLALNFLVGSAFTICPTKFVFHLPCPGCGMTRAILSLFQGDFAGALYYNANSFVILPLLAFFAVSLTFDLVLNKTLAFKIFKHLDAVLSKWPVILLFVIFEIAVEWHSIACGI